MSNKYIEGNDEINKNPVESFSKKTKQKNTSNNAKK